MKVGKSIQKIRKEHDLSQEQFANMFHVTRQTVSNWENEKSYPDLQTLIAISEQFGVSLDTLMKEDPQMVKEIDDDRKKVKIFTLILVSLLPFLVGQILTLWDLHSSFPMIGYNGIIIYLAVWGYVCYRVATPERKWWIQLGILNIPGVVTYIKHMYEYIVEIERAYTTPFSIHQIMENYFYPISAIPHKIYMYIDTCAYITQNFKYSDFWEGKYIVIIYTGAWFVIMMTSVIAVLMKIKKK